MADFLKKLKQKTAHEPNVFQPTIFDLKNEGDVRMIEKLLDDNPLLKIVDTYEEQLEELREIGDTDSGVTDGVWIYYPWLSSLVHILREDKFIKLRTSRNFPLITLEEQAKFADAKIGFAGLNVGNPGAICITLEGGSRSMKFADFDKLSLSNLNRFRAGLCELGTPKIIISARQAYEIDPFIDIEMFDQGLSSENIDRFLIEPKIDLLIEEMDNLKLKVEVREKAKKYKIPVLMVTAGGVIDVERYDLDENIEILNGHLRQDVIDRINAVRPTTTTKEKAGIARDFIGEKYLSKRLIESFALIGDGLPSIPQLSEWTFLRGAILCHFARMILIGENVPSGRYNLRLSDALKNKE